MMYDLRETGIEPPKNLFIGLPEILITRNSILCVKNWLLPWLGSSAGWSVVTYNKRLGVQFLARAHT